MSEFAEVVFWMAVVGACLSYLGHLAWRRWLVRRLREYICVECGLGFANAPGSRCAGCESTAADVDVS